MLRLSPASTAATTDTRAEALAAPVRDPLWMLARQWQTRGFIADDAGTPLHVRLAAATGPVRAGGPDGAPVTAIEPLVEAEPLPAIDDLDHARLVTLASELARWLRAAGAGTGAAAAAVRAALAAAFPFTPTGAGPTVRPFAGRIPDPRALYHLLVPALGPTGKGGKMPAIPGLPAAQAAAVETACRGWLAWLAPRLSVGGGAAGAGAAAGRAPTAWDPERLEYRFALGARLPEAAVKLVADEYDGAGVEWFTFENGGFDTHGGTGGGPLPVEVRPAPVTYPGMPRPRFWELEDGDVNLDTLGATDPAHAVLVAFAHQYANDWFLVPLRVPAGVTTLHGFTVTDTFGGTTEVPAVAAVDGGRGPWRLWDLTAAPGVDPAAGAGARLLVPPAPAPAAGEVLEDVLVVRDEMANLAWVIERTTRDADGQAVDRFQRHLRLRPPADPAFDPGDRPDDRRRYRLGTTVPDFWYPLVSTTDAGGRPLLARAALPPGATGVSDEGVRGELIPHGPATVIADEEVPREGAHVTRQDRLVTGSPGGPALVVWRSRTKTPGLGEASSGLRFDLLD